MNRAAPVRSPAPQLHPLRRNGVWRSIQLLLQGAFAVLFRYRALGVEHIPRTGGALLLINHQSHLDPLLVGLPLDRPVSYLARDSLFRVPIIGWILRKTYVVPIKRDSPGSSSIRQATERLRQGFLVGVFPEGTRSRDGRLGPLKPGFVSLIRRGRVPVIPVGIAGGHEAFPPGALLIRPTRVCVVFGNSLPSEEVERLSGRGHEEELMALARERIRQCQEEAEIRRRAGTKPTGQ